MWGQQPQFHKACLKSLNKITNTDTVQVTTISFLWHAGGVLYVRDWNAAAGKGEKLGPLVGFIKRHFKGNADVFCHSMGNRLFEGALRTMPAGDRSFRHIVLFSADLDNTLEDPDMQNCLKATGHLFVYIHHRDKLLFTSELAHGRKRLGRSGFDAVTQMATTIDMTHHAHDFQNHTHLYRKWVQRSIRQKSERVALQGFPINLSHHFLVISARFLYIW